MNNFRQLFKKVNKTYWANQKIDYNSMLGGYNEINDVDIIQSEQFLIKNIRSFQSVLELGCGVGRISEQLLIKYFKELHLVERESKFIEEAQKRLFNKNAKFFECSAEDFIPNQCYDCVWIQWISMYLTDEEFCRMLLNYKTSPIILKENISKQDYIFDEDDASITRSESIFNQLLEICGFKIVDSEYQQGLPEDIYKIKLMLLKHNDYI